MKIIRGYVRDIAESMDEIASFMFLMSTALADNRTTNAASVVDRLPFSNL
jgi:hypothetical protein